MCRLFFFFFFFLLCIKPCEIVEPAERGGSALPSKEGDGRRWKTYKIEYFFFEFLDHVVCLQDGACLSESMSVNQPDSQSMGWPA